MVAIGEQAGKRYAFLQIAESLYLVRIMPQGAPIQTDVVIGPLAGDISAIDWDNNWLIVDLVGTESNRLRTKWLWVNAKSRASC